MGTVLGSLCPSQLALGAIAEGCVDSILQYLPQLVPWLIATLADQKSLIRSITCWTLSRYSKWVTEQADQSSYLQPMMQELLKRVLDHNKKVQEAACSAFATLEEDAGNLLVPYIGPILQNLIFAFSKYQQKNLLILYDAIGTLADAVGGALNTPEHVGVLLPPLVERWNGITDDDKSLFPLLECFTSIAQALGPGFTTFAQPVFTRCVALIDSTLRHEQQNVDVDKEFIVCSLDMISGMTEGMGAAVAPFVKQTQLPMYLLACMKDAMPDVRQSAYALVGDIAKACIEELAAVLPEYLPLLTEQLDHRTVSVCNNASWAIGELAIKMGPSMQPYVEGVLAKLVPIINKHEEVNKSLVENTAITLGRLGLVCPEVGAPHLEHFIKPWCMALRSIRDDIEKDHAFQGLCRMLRINPRAPLTHMAELFDAFASWTQPPEVCSLRARVVRASCARLLRALAAHLCILCTPVSMPPHLRTLPFVCMPPDLARPCARPCACPCATHACHACMPRMHATHACHVCMPRMHTHAPRMHATHACMHASLASCRLSPPR